MQSRHRLGFCRREFGGSLGLLSLEGGEPVFQRRRVGAVLDRLDDAGDLAVGLGEHALRAGAFGGGIGCQAAEFGVELLDEGADEFGRHHVFPQAGKDPVLNLPAPDRQAVRTGALRATCRTAVTVNADDRIAATATSADEKPAQKEATAVSAIERVAVFVAGDCKLDLLLARLDPVAQILADDPEVRDLGGFPALRRIRAGNPLSCARVLDVAAAVPFEAPYVERVIEDPGAALGLTSNRGVAPRASSRPRHILGIELLCDRAWAAARGEFGKDAVHDRGLSVVDATLAGCLCDDVVRIGLATRELSLKGPAKLPAPGLLA